ncbi:hypothetical protein OH807_16010 [Kitasatospora sp. NBC_01560]|uniref:hypothetical protein n=1 Tax=Kitasatospora sp. NBC_01560 TaxID=2975965 RepID=UPI00386DAF25
MSIEHRELTDRLVALADEPAPPPGFDAGRSVARGRARLRRRRAAAVGVVAAVTAALVTGTLALRPDGGGASLPPASEPVATSSPTPTATLLAGADPLTTEVGFGWLPSWVNGVGYQAGQYGFAATAGGEGISLPSIRLSLFPAGPEPALDLTPGRPEVRTEAPAVGGRAAYWLDRKGYESGGRLLRWLTSSGRWAQISAYGGQQSDRSEEILLRVAAGATFGQRDVPLPFRFAGLPESFRPTDVSLTRRTGTARPWIAEALFDIGGKQAKVTVTPELDLGPEAELFLVSPVCRVEQGLRICASKSPGRDTPAALDRLGDLPGLLGLVHVTGVDESTWTTDVVG